MGEPHSAQHGGGFGELNVLITNDLDAVAPWIEEIKKRPGKDRYARLGKGRADGFLIVDNEAEMPTVVRALGTPFLERDKRSIKAAVLLLLRSLSSKRRP